MKKCLTMAVTLLALCATLCVPLRADAEPVSPKRNQTEPPEPHWELFLDDYIIERSTGFQRVLHHPQPRGIVIPADKPWETQGLSPQREANSATYIPLQGETPPCQSHAESSSRIPPRQPQP